MGHDLGTASRRAIEAVWRIEAPRLIGGLVRLVRDVERAEDLAQDALASALERWPETGIPENPGAWLMTTARNRALDELRRAKMLARKHEAIAHEPPRPSDLERLEAAVDAGVEDDLLRLILVACHPVLSAEARAALTLRLVAGLSTEEIARAFLQPEPTIAQRIVRAKSTLAEAKVPFEVPKGAELSARVPSVLEVIYLIFNEGYAATRGDDWLRPQLCEDALRIGRILVGLIPTEAEAHGLLALMELTAARAPARTRPDGTPVLLLDQDRSRWDRTLLKHGLAALARAESLARPLGPYAVQAAIAGCHARAHIAADTDWPRIVALYDALVEMTGSPVVELNRAVAVGMAFGPEPALILVDGLADEPALRAYHHLPSVRADLLIKLERWSDAVAELERAASLARNSRERDLLLERARTCRAKLDAAPN